MNPSMLLTSNRMIPMSTYNTYTVPPTKSNDKASLQPNLEKIRYSMENHKYQKYLAEVNALNTVKTFLKENRDKLSEGNR